MEKWTSSPSSTISVQLATELVMPSSSALLWASASLRMGNAWGVWVTASWSRSTTSRELSWVVRRSTTVLQGVTTTAEPCRLHCTIQSEMISWETIGRMAS